MAIVHFEIHAADPHRCIHFYEQTFGWSHDMVPGLDQQYWLVWPTGEDPADVTGRGPYKGIGGGILVRPGEPPVDGQPVNAFVCIIEVDDLARAHDNVVTHGGAIVVPPAEFPGVGRVFYAKDPEGNVFGVLEPSPGAMAQAA